MDLVAYLIVNEDNAGQYYPDFAFCHPLFSDGMRIYSDSKVCRFLKSVTKEQTFGFLNDWNSRRDHKQRIYISYDSTNKNCQAGEIDLIEYGKAKDDKGIPVFNIAIAFDNTNRVPLFYEEYPGSITDVSQFIYTVDKVSDYRYKKIMITLICTMTGKGILSLMKRSINDGSPAGGTGMQYFVGEFDGQKFIADSNQEKGLWIDYGKDFYAGVTWNHVPKDRRLMIAWADNWQYRDYLPTSPFKGQMSCVRELKLVQKEKKYILKQLPVKEMECLRTNKHEMKNIKMGADEEWTLCDKKEVLELDISYPIEKIHAQTFGIKISTGKNRQFEIVFCKEKQCCFVDRTTTGVNPHDKFAGKYKAPVDFTQEFLTIKLLMDVSQSELFINNGEVVMSNLLFPEDFYKVKLFATGGDLVIEKSIIYEMDEIMNHPLDGDLI